MGCILERLVSRTITKVVIGILIYLIIYVFIYLVIVNSYYYRNINYYGTIYTVLAISGTLSLIIIVVMHSIIMRTETKISLNLALLVAAVTFYLDLFTRSALKLTIYPLIVIIESNSHYKALIPDLFQILILSMIILNRKHLIKYR